MNFRVESEYAQFWIENGILFFVYKKGVVIDRSVAIRIVKDRLLLQQGKAFLNFSDIRGVKGIDKAARNYLAVEGSILIKATALLVDNPLADALSKFFLKASRPVIPTKVFTDKAAAFSFLETHR